MIMKGEEKEKKAGKAEKVSREKKKNREKSNEQRVKKWKKKGYENIRKSRRDQTRKSRQGKVKGKPKEERKEVTRGKKKGKRKGEEKSKQKERTQKEIQDYRRWGRESGQADWKGYNEKRGAFTESGFFYEIHYLSVCIITPSKHRVPLWLKSHSLLMREDLKRPSGLLHWHLF